MTIGSSNTQHLQGQLSIGNATEDIGYVGMTYKARGANHQDIVYAATYWNTTGGNYGTQGYFGIAVTDHANDGSDAYGVTEGELEDQTHFAITHEGYVGIGTTSPSYNLDLTYAGEILTGKIHLFNDQQTIAATANTLALFGKNANGGIGFYTTDTTTFSDAKMYIINNGNVGIGTTSPSATLDVSGDVKATSFNATSDYRVKENVQTISGGIYTIDNLRPVSYVLKESQEPHIGFIAYLLSAIYEI